LGKRFVLLDSIPIVSVCCCETSPLVSWAWRPSAWTNDEPVTDLANRNYHSFLSFNDLFLFSNSRSLRNHEISQIAL